MVEQRPQLDPSSECSTYISYKAGFFLPAISANWKFGGLEKSYYYELEGCVITWGNE